MKIIQILNYLFIIFSGNFGDFLFDSFQKFHFLFNKFNEPRLSQFNFFFYLTK